MEGKGLSSPEKNFWRRQCITVFFVECTSRRCIHVCRFIAVHCVHVRVFQSSAAYMLFYTSMKLDQFRM